ncbi:helix-turn-helix transcriptional regulator [Paenibacillus roseipurpureus]|uniref:AraC family transcriptional regulator n=1 Tax=Paenibacillus roseopurpureus TaxID=2918901 RepID=A0AA96RL46_9BACL|nr:AraC family transcriptional regulator [Paenibacillus sp. MBLB1832]WNR42742.1 AraC family transcriptional regulator [Paenibacillus sp. MBLB1832]
MDVPYVPTTLSRLDVFQKPMKTTPNRHLNKSYFHDDIHVQLQKHILTEPVELHWHEFYELAFVLEGQGMNWVNGFPQRLKQGDMFLLTPADFHEIAPDSGTKLELYNLIFSQAMLTDDMVKLLFYQNEGHYAAFLTDDSFADVLFRFNSMMKEQQLHAAGRDIALSGDLNRLLLAWQRNRVHEDAKAEGIDKEEHRSFIYPSHPGIQKSLIYLQHHFRQSITLEDAAKQAHLSPNYFSEQFKKSTGISFQLYLQGLRLQFAHALLLTSQLPVTEICLISGFNTLTHFERVFRLHYGMSPREAQKDSAH